MMVMMLDASDRFRNENENTYGHSGRKNSVCNVYARNKIGFGTKRKEKNKERDIEEAYQVF